MKHHADAHRRPILYPIVVTVCALLAYGWVAVTPLTAAPLAADDPAGEHGAQAATSADAALPGTPEHLQRLRDTPPKDLLALRLLTTRSAMQTPHRTVIAQAYNPYDGSPIADLAITLEVLFEDDESYFDPQVLHGTTSAGGVVHWQLELPSTRHGSISVGLVARAEYRGLVQEVEATEYAEELYSDVLLSTDRHLYQPGQTVHLRGLWLDSIGRPSGHQEVTLEIMDEQSRTVAEAERTTSELGIASFDWTIPETAQSGEYMVEVTPDLDYFAAASFEVRPYEPSTLWLEATPRQAVLLPDDTARIDVVARYVNGDPLVGATVETFDAGWRRRHSASGAQAIKSLSEVVITDASGRATIELDMASRFADLSPYHEFEDLTLSARVTDPRSRLAEAKRFTLRLSRHPVQIYSVGDLGSPGIPHDVYAFTQRVDGSAVSTSIEVRRLATEGAPDEPYEVVGRVRTNAYGVASFSHLPLRADASYELVALADATLPAADGTAADGSKAEDRASILGVAEAEWYEEDDLQLMVERPVIKAGDPLVVQLHTARPVAQIDVVVIDAEGHSLVQRRGIEVEGSMELSFPYQDTFQGPLQLLAYSLDPQLAAHWPFPAAGHMVFYPAVDSQAMTLSMAGDGSAYRPGDTARLDLRVQGPQGPAAVAVAVVDRATESRQENLGLGSGAALLAPLAAGLYPSGLDTDDDIGAWNLNRLLNLPATERTSEEAQEVARGLSRATSFHLPTVDITNPLLNQRRVFTDLIATPPNLRDALSFLQSRGPDHVVDAPTFRSALLSQGVDLAEWSDPWGQAYQIKTHLRGKWRRFLITSIGRDGQADSLDDFTVWSTQWSFGKRLGKALETALKAYLAQGPHLLDDTQRLAEAVAPYGITWFEERDPWGHLYYVDWYRVGNNFRQRLMSPGPDGIRQEPGEENADDIEVWEFRIPFTAHYEGTLRTAFDDDVWDDRLPTEEASFRRHLLADGIDTSGWHGPWQRPLYFTFSQRSLLVDVWRADAAGRSTPAPGRQTFDVVQLWTLGQDGEWDTRDDLQLAEVVRPRGGPKAFFANLNAPGGDDDPSQTPRDHGLLLGLAALEDGTLIPGMLITAVRIDEPAPPKTAVTGDDGVFRMLLPPGRYTVLAELEGMRTTSHSDVQVVGGERLELSLFPTVDFVEESIVLTAELTTRSSGEPKTLDADLPPPTVPRRSTPRLRKDFPETLFWLAEGRFGDDGRLELEVPLADSITRWHVAALASDGSGQLAGAEIDWIVDQPFFLQPDLPPLLTAGDALALPVDVHNKTGQSLPLQLALRQGGTEDLRVAIETQRTWTAPRGVERLPIWQTFPDAGPRHVRWTATPGPEVAQAISGDAVQETTHVNFRGALHVETQNRLVNNDTSLPVAIPSNALPGSGELEVVIYDDLEDHLIDTLESLAHQPTGCAEQTTSSAWIHALLVERLAQRGDSDSPMFIESRDHLIAAWRALPSFVVEGGFGYWRDAERHDLALTAYILEFLTASRRWVKLDDAKTAPLDADFADGLIDNAAEFLRSRQRPDGSWSSSKTAETSQATRLRQLRTDAFVARSLGMHALALNDTASRHAAERALPYLHGHLGEDPYGLALMTHLATLLDDGSNARVRHIGADGRSRLLALATPSEGAVYWQLRANTPFYGGGTSARIATTALAVQALAARASSPTAPPSGESVPMTENLAAGYSYLLTQKDALGSWFTTQASVQALRSLSAMFPAREEPADRRALSVPTLARTSHRIPTARPYVHESTALRCNSAPRRTASTPASLHGSKPCISKDLRPLATKSGDSFGLDGQPLVKVAEPDGYVGPQRWRTPLDSGTQALLQHRSEDSWRLLQARVRSYLPWDAAEATAATANLDFAVHCPDGPLTLGEDVTCRVRIARKHFRGSGMLIAEIGLPPGAQVDTAALHEARRRRDIRDFEIWPGRAVLYVWPKAQTIEIDITWRPRLALKAAAQPSKLYEYYTPEERVVLAPLDFVVEDP